MDRPKCSLGKMLAEKMRNRNFAELKMMPRDAISSYRWYRVTDALALLSGRNARSTRIVIKVAMRRIDGKTSAVLKMEMALCMCDPMKTGIRIKLRRRYIGVSPG